ncbi:nickel/cobalt efflux transporter RcnA [Brevundimonas sp. AJA228-03]|uniref:nickel/cobalt efflux transporter n=1 Tax=Brevundimonas sp. AJA228-03 TaxID=2752515 RepID=UPI001AE03396|nr:nickel/cobalt efflux transporter [Brevundimonas sp. AJA228-03]QTN20881.1 nickel/cobalt efflux transporter RcnA [Brevundimonas sp. AJA228-03]
MTPFADLLQQGSAHAWLFIPSALLLGALHGLEPGHSKTMMAAFIVAVRGTVWQAMLLGLSATLSHTAIVWAIALAGLYFGRNLDLESSEPWFQLASALIILGVAAWMIFATWREQRAAPKEHDHEHDHGHAHDETRRIDTGHGVLILGIFEDDVPPEFRITAESGPLLEADDVIVTTTRAGGATQSFTFERDGDRLRSTEAIPEPHAFAARLTIGHRGHVHAFEVNFSEDGHDHGHDHGGLDVSDPGYQDAHERAHANDIKARFANRKVTTWQIILFGLTGGLIPCPASITVLLLCLQLKQVALGATLVLCFSIGLAVTMVTVGVVAALGMRHAEKRWAGGFATFARRAPYASGALISIVGVVLTWQAIVALTA